MHNQITSGLMVENSADRILEINPSPQISFLRGRDSDDVLLSLAGSYGGVAGGTEFIFSNPSNQRCPVYLSESDATLFRFREFIGKVNCCSLLGDNRPLFLYNFLERIDEAVDTAPILESLIATGRQVFIAVPAHYPVDTLFQRTKQEEKEYDAAVYEIGSAQNN